MATTATAGDGAFSHRHLLLGNSALISAAACSSVSFIHAVPLLGNKDAVR
jgi:hypothetical protein